MESRTTVAIPLDIIECVIDALAADEDTTSPLKAVSQTCRALHSLCRKHIFATVKLSSKSDNSRHFNDLLSASPDIAPYVQDFQYCLSEPSDDDQQVLDVLQKHAPLRRVYLWSPRWEGADWSAFPASIRSSLLSLIQLPTITDIAIRCFTNFPATALLHCHNLVDLEITQLELTSSEVEHVSIIPRPISLTAASESCGALKALLQIAGPDSGPIVDFSLLRSASFEVETTEGILIAQEIIKTTPQLESLSIGSEYSYKKVFLESFTDVVDTYWQPLPVALAGLGASLNANSCQALKSAKFDIVIEGDHYDPLCGLSSELRALSGNNVLEELELLIFMQTDVTCRTRSDDWTDLDAVLTGPGFSALHRVSVEIEWGSFSRNNEAVESVLKSLTAERFPRLSESVTVMFEFSAQHVYV